MHKKNMHISGIIATHCCTAATVENYLSLRYIFNKESFMSRDDMIQYDILGRGISNPLVIGAMYEVPREKFIENSQKKHAFDDNPLPIGHGQTISQPYIVALMTELCSPDPEDIALEIGTGSGYQTAVLALLTKHVYSVERIFELHQDAEKKLSSMNIKNVTLYHRDGYDGVPEAAPFDIIMITSAPVEVPESLFSQLKNGGRLVAPIGSLVQELILYKKENGKISSETICHVQFVPMIKGIINN